jgi:hypothetical protein
MQGGLTEDEMRGRSHREHLQTSLSVTAKAKPLLVIITAPGRPTGAAPSPSANGRGVRRGRLAEALATRRHSRAVERPWPIIPPLPIGLAQAAQFGSNPTSTNGASTEGRELTAARPRRRVQPFARTQRGIAKTRANMSSRRETRSRRRSDRHRRALNAKAPEI